MIQRICEFSLEFSTCKIPMYTAKERLRSWKVWRTRNLATSEDRFILARLYEAIDDWPKAREKYRELNLRTRNLRDMETLNRRPCISLSSQTACFDIASLDDKQDLAEAQRACRRDQAASACGDWDVGPPGGDPSDSQ